MANSMTAFASVNGSTQYLSWAWEIRSVNGRGLDMRVRLAEGFEVLETEVRKNIAAVCKRGTITIGLRVKKSVSERGARLNPEAMECALEAANIATQATKLEVAPLDIAAVLGLPGVFSRRDMDGDSFACAMESVKNDLGVAVKAFAQARAAEGAALGDIIRLQIEQINRLCAAAVQLLAAREDHQATSLQSNIARLLGEVASIDESRLAQELAIIAVKSDVVEELDRLGAHVTAAQELLASNGPIGRKFDFLTQEFNREANTLCSKANFTGLTGIGLDLKTIIDQMREQVQNVE